MDELIALSTVNDFIGNGGVWGREKVYVSAILATTTLDVHHVLTSLLVHLELVKQFEYATDE